MEKLNYTAASFQGDPETSVVEDSIIAKTWRAYIEFPGDDPDPDVIFQNPMTKVRVMRENTTRRTLGLRAHILVQVTIYRRLRIGRDGHLDQSEAYDISNIVREDGPWCLYYPSDTNSKCVKQYNYLMADSYNFDIFLWPKKLNFPMKQNSLWKPTEQTEIYLPCSDFKHWMCYI